MNPSAPRATWSVDHVSFRHDGALDATLRDVTFDVPAGRITALLGPNGAGKTTLLQLLLGVLAPHQGAITFRDHPIAAWKRQELARAVGVVPQGEEHPFPLLARELVMMGRYPHVGAWRDPRAIDVQAVDGAMARCAVTPFAGRAIQTLSGGERQRTLLARALAQVWPGEIHHSPAPGEQLVLPALALDEPTSALDVRHEMAIFELLFGLRMAGFTILLVTHHLNLAARYADHLVLLRDGRVVTQGAPGDVFTQPRLESTFEWPVIVTPHPGPGRDTNAPQLVPLARADGAP